MLKSNIPTVSVVMPVFNSARYLPPAIESILNQTYTNFELIIINDGSTDSTGQIIKKFAKKNSKIVVLKNSKNLGICKSLNMGLKQAEGKYIARMDGDDWSYPERLSKQVSFMESHPKVVICGGAIEVCDSRLRVKNQRRYPGSDKEIREKILKINPFAHSAVMFQRRAAVRAGGYDEKLFSAEDYDLYFRLGKYGKFANLNDNLLKLRVGRGSVSCRLANRQALTHMYVRLKAAVEYAYPWSLPDAVYFVFGLVGILVIPGRYKFGFYNFLRRFQK